MNAEAAGWRVSEVEVTYLPRTRKVQGDGHRGWLRAHRAGHEPGARPVTAPAPESETTLIVIAKEPSAGPGQDAAGCRRARTIKAAALAEAALTDNAAHRAHGAGPAADPGPGGQARPVAARRGFDVRAAVRRPARRTPRLCLRRRSGPALLIGMDTRRSPPACSPSTGKAPTPCSARPPTADSGRSDCGVPDPLLLRGVPMSTTSTGAIQRTRCSRPGCASPTCRNYAMWDTAADAVAVARQAPKSRFRCAGSGAGDGPQPGQQPSPGCQHDARGDCPVRRGRCAGSTRRCCCGR